MDNQDQTNLLKSALAKRLQQRFDISAADLQPLERIVTPGGFVRRGVMIVERGGEVNGALILRSGWAVARVHGPSRKPAITRLFLPGDLINLSELGFGRAPLDISMVSDGSIGIIPRVTLRRLASDAPELYSRLVEFDQMEHTTTQRQLYAVSRLSAEQRLKHFFLAIHERVNEIQDPPSDRFPFYLQRTQIGDLNGLSPVTISLQLSRMHENGTLKLSGKVLELMAREAWIDELRYAPILQPEGFFRQAS